MFQLDLIEPFLQFLSTIGVLPQKMLISNPVSPWTEKNTANLHSSVDGIPLGGLNILLLLVSDWPRSEYKVCVLQF